MYKINQAFITYQSKEQESPFCTKINQYMTNRQVHSMPECLAERNATNFMQV